MTNRVVRAGHGINTTRFLVLVLTRNYGVRVGYTCLPPLFVAVDTFRLG